MVRTVFRGESISYGYDKKRPVLKELSITIPDQSIYGLIGPAGAGKTTLIKVMLGLEKTDQGKLTWFNERLNASTNRRVGYVPSNPALLYDLTVYENVQIFGKLYRYKGARLKRQVEQVLQFVGLWEVRNRKASLLSPLLKQQLNIACGIVHLPDVVVFDEPIKGMMPSTKDIVLNSIRQLHEHGVTIIYLSQNVKEIQDICTHVGIMHEGKVIMQGKIEELLQQYDQKYALVRLELTDHAEKLQGELGDYKICELEAQSMIVELRLNIEQELQRIKTILGDKLLHIDLISPKFQQFYACLTNREFHVRSF